MAAVRVNLTEDLGDALEAPPPIENAPECYTEREPKRWVCDTLFPHAADASWDTERLVNEVWDAFCAAYRYELRDRTLDVCVRSRLVELGWFERPNSLRIVVPTYVGRRIARLVDLALHGAEPEPEDEKADDEEPAK